MDMQTSLLREKFLIRENGEDDNVIEAVGNRLALPLTRGANLASEHFVIRGRTMHCVTRMAAAMAQEYGDNGPLLNRLNKGGWQNLWNDSYSAHDNKIYDKNWIAIYHEGKPLFMEGEVHPFLHVMEQCDARNRAEYDKAIRIAEDVFKNAGKIVSIEHDTTIAMVAGIMPEGGRCGLIMRMPGHTSTFNFLLSPTKDGQKGSPESVRPHHLLDCAADFMEALQISVRIGLSQAKMERNAFTAADDKALKADRTRLGRLTQTLEQSEKLFNFKYRPERPDFIAIAQRVESQINAKR